MAILTLGKRCKRARNRLASTGAAGWLLLSFGVNPAPAQKSSPGEYQVKAAFMYHFAQFVDWPAGTFRDATSPLVYCVLGNDPFGGALELSLAGKSIETHPLQVRHLGDASEGKSCHVVFVAMAEKKAASEALEHLKGAPVLTVGDSEHFAQAGGMIGFRLEENKVRFEINLGAAEQAKLKISARLLALARTVIYDQTKGN